MAPVSIRIVDDAGCIVWEARVAGAPEAVLRALRSRADDISRIGLEAGPTSAWIAGRRLEAGLPVMSIEIRHVKAGPSAMTVKPGRDDACGLARVVRSGRFRARSGRVRMIRRCRDREHAEAL